MKNKWHNRFHVEVVLNLNVFSEFSSLHYTSTELMAERRVVFYKLYVWKTNRHNVFIRLWSLFTGRLFYFVLHRYEFLINFVYCFVHSLVITIRCTNLLHITWAITKNQLWQLLMWSEIVQIQRIHRKHVIKIGQGKQ